MKPRFRLSPFRKAVVSGILAAVICAAVYYQWPPLAIAAALAEPIAVYWAKNTPEPEMPCSDEWHH